MQGASEKCRTLRWLFLSIKITGKEVTRRIARLIYGLADHCPKFFFMEVPVDNDYHLIKEWRLNPQFIFIKLLFYTGLGGDDMANAQNKNLDFHWSAPELFISFLLGVVVVTGLWFFSGLLLMIFLV